MIPTNLPVPDVVWTFDDRRLRAGKGLLKLAGLKWCGGVRCGMVGYRGRPIFAAALYATEDEAAQAARTRIWQLESQVRTEYHTRMAKLGRAVHELARTTIPEATDGP